MSSFKNTARDSRLDKNRVKLVPEHPFSLLITAPKSSGKTTLLLNMLTDLYPNEFNNIIVICPTLLGDSKWDSVRELGDSLVSQNKPLIKEIQKRRSKKSIMGGETERYDNLFTVKYYTEFDPDIIKDLRDSQQTIIDEFGRKFQNKTLLLIDDSIGSSMWKSRAFNSAWIEQRHLNLSMIIVTQSYKALKPIYRTNFSNHIVFEIPNNAETEKIYDENPCFLSKTQWMKVYQEATKDNFNFLHINYQNKKGFQMIKNFDNVLQYS